MPTDQETVQAQFPETLESLSRVVSAGGAAQPETFTPAVPQTLEQTGLNPSVIEQLLLKIIHFRGEVIGRDLAGTLGLKYSLIDPIVEHLKRQRMVEFKGSLGYGNVSAAFALSEAGRNRAKEYLEANQYAGAAPVPIDQYAAAVRAQRKKSGWLTRSRLESAYQHMVVNEQIISQIGPAVNSGKSFLIYGQPGNGKTYLAEALFKLDESCVYVPYALECQGVIVKLFDPLYHRLKDDGASRESSLFEPQYDGRWARCKRPFIVTGGELSLDMLDLSYNHAAKVYDAPFQLKANNGIYLIDDFGRQKASPTEVLNRWIVPMDRHVDFLTFHTGGKVEVPFETFLIFSTNLPPERLGDEAFLRRIQYKMLMKSPPEEEFREIFRRYCASEGLECSEELLSDFIARRYRAPGKPFRRCQPRDVVSHAIDLVDFEGLPRELTADVLDRAFDGCFVDTSACDD